MSKTWGHIVGDWKGLHPKECAVLRSRDDNIFHNYHLFKYALSLDTLKLMHARGIVTDEYTAKHYDRLMKQALEETTPENITILQVMDG